MWTANAARRCSPECSRASAAGPMRSSRTGCATDTTSGRPALRRPAATVADVVPLTGENRILVRHGLKLLAQSHWTGVRALVETAGLTGKPIKSGHVGFILAPRLNAAGRIGDANDGLRLLLSNDPQEARSEEH